jgi:hypothetical protein
MPQPHLRTNNSQASLSQHFDQTSLPTPVRSDRLEFWLQGYDPTLRHYLVDGFQNGFDIGFSGELPTVEVQNMKSAKDNPAVVDGKLSKELQAGRISGPHSHQPLPNFHLSPLAVVEKKVAGTFRLIHHLSFPEGQSVNSGIPDSAKTVSYSTIGDAMSMVQELGPACFFSKTDILSAYRIVPLKPSQYHLLGFSWRGQFYYDKCLPMGCSSSCKIFESISTALQWIGNHKLGISHMVHVIDDFLFLAVTSSTCESHLRSFLAMCADIGIPIALDKTFYPSTTMCFVGYELDSVMMEARLPPDKLEKGLGLLTQFIRSGKNKLRLKELQSIIGFLNFTCAVVLPGRAFLRRMIDLTIGVRKSFHFIRITKPVLDDMLMWEEFLQHFNGRSLFLSSIWITSPHLHLYTDASASLGFGAVFGSSWFFGEWDNAWRYQNITLLELYPILVSLKVWGQLFSNKCVLFHTDNQALVSVINNQTSKETKVMHLIRQLVLITLQHNILFQAVHIMGSRNCLADHLSRLQLARFRRLHPTADLDPSTIPQLPPLPP